MTITNSEPESVSSRPEASHKEADSHKFQQTEHLVFFVDLLGTSDAVANWNDPKKVGELTRMLQDLKETSRNFELHQFGRLGPVRWALPAISAFSDNVLISFDLVKMKSGKVGEPISEAFWVAQELIGALALQALELGLLIRGGASLGSLYHHEGVAVGKGLIEAYKLERTVAQYPRIPVSRKIYQSAGAPFPEILTDEDGVRYFDYLPTMIGSDKGRRDACRRSAQINIDRFEEQEKWNEMSKWVWFLKKLENMDFGEDRAGQV